MNYQVIFHLETKANILSYNCLYVPKKPFAVTPNVDVPQENECQIWNQHPKVIQKSHVIFSFNTKSAFLLTCVMCLREGRTMNNLLSS